MIIEQTVEIPASHRITIDVPHEIPAGPAILAFRPAASLQEKTVRPLSSLVGIDKGRDTLDAYFARKRADKAREDTQIEKLLRRSQGL